MTLDIIKQHLVNLEINGKYHTALEIVYKIGKEYSNILIKDVDRYNYYHNKKYRAYLHRCGRELIMHYNRNLLSNNEINTKTILNNNNK